MARQYVIVGSLIAAVVAVAALFVALTHRHPAARAAAPAAAPALETASFQSTYQPGWSLTTQTGPHGVHRYQLSSNGVPVGPLDIPQAGGVAITIDESPAAAPAGAHAHAAGRAAGAGAFELLPGAVGVPKGAAAVARTSLRRTTLAGVAAGEESYVYIHENRENVQVDLLAVRGARSVLVELDAEPTLVPEGQAGLGLITGHWTWH